MAALAPPRDIPVVVISGGDQPAEQIAAHRGLSEHSDAGRHVIAARSGHWILFDEPDLIVGAIRSLVDASQSGDDPVLQRTPLPRLERSER
jgi:pimeloyl-ACP methyl ester carboxylesterase